MKFKSLNFFVFSSLVIIFFSLMSFTPAKETSKFWGTLTTQGACGPNSNGDGGCSAGIYETYYVFWISTGQPKPTNQTVPCDCSQVGTVKK